MERVLDTMAVAVWIVIQLAVSAVFFSLWLVLTPIEIAVDGDIWISRFAKELRA